MSGFGVLKSSKNDIQYFGNIFLGYCHGYGILIINSFLYIGEFLYSNFHGNGIFQEKGKNIIPQFNDIYMKGYFSKNKLMHGIKSYSNGIFYGIFDEFGYRKEGEMIFINNDYYKGQWYEDEFCNYGIYRWNIPNNNLNKCLRVIPIQYKGNWLNGKFNGLGILEFDERVIICIWKDNIINGAGILIAANGDIFIHEEMFENGRYLRGHKLILTEEKKKIIFDILKIFDVNITSIKSKKLLKSNKINSPSNKSVEEISFFEFIENYFSKNNDLIEWKNQIKFVLENFDDCKSYKNQQTIFNISSTTKNFNCQDYFIESIKILTANLYEIPTTFLPFFLPKFSINFCITPIINFLILNFPHHNITNTNTNFVNFEIRSISQAIAFNFHYIELLYKKYATFEINCYRDDVILTRIGLWYFYENIFKNQKKYFISDLIQEADELYENLSYELKNPFKPIYYCEFIKHLLYIVIKLSSQNPHIKEKVIVKKIYPFYGIFAQIFILFLKEIIKINETIIITDEYDNAIEMIRKSPRISYNLFEIIKNNVKYDIGSIFKFLMNLIKTEEFIEILKKQNNFNFPVENIKESDSFYSKIIFKCISEVFPLIEKSNFIVKTTFTVTPLELLRIIIKLFEKMLITTSLK